ENGGLTSRAASAPLWMSAPISVQTMLSASHSETASMSPAAQFTAKSPTIPMRGALPQSVGSVMSMGLPSRVLTLHRNRATLLRSGPQVTQLRLCQPCMLTQLTQPIGTDLVPAFVSRDRHDGLQVVDRLDAG